jgi:hypothetical protein
MRRGILRRTAGQGQLHGLALARVMPWQVATYLLAALAMISLSKAAAPTMPDRHTAAYAVWSAERTTPPSSGG